MIDERYGYYECGLEGERFQDLVEGELVWSEELQEQQQEYVWDEAASGARLWDHWYEVHDKNRDGELD